MRGSTFYACATNIRRGNAACSNRLRVAGHIVEEGLLATIEQELFTEERVGVLVLRQRSYLNRKQGHSSDRATINQQLDGVNKTIANIIQAIKAGIISLSTKVKLKKAEAERM